VHCQHSRHLVAFPVLDALQTADGCGDHKKENLKKRSISRVTAEILFLLLYGYLLCALPVLDALQTVEFRQAMLEAMGVEGRLKGDNAERVDEIRMSLDCARVERSP